MDSSDFAMTNLLLWPLSRICSVTLQRVILTRKEENKDHRIASHRIVYRFIQSVASSCATKDARYAGANRPESRQSKMHNMQMQIGRNLDRTVYCKWEKQRSLPKQKEGTHARTPLHIQAPGASLATGAHTQKKISRNSSGIIHRGEG